MTRYPYTTIQNYPVFWYIYLLAVSFVFKRNGCLHIKWKSPLTNPHSAPPTLIPFPSPLFTGNHYQEFGLYPSNPFRKHFLKTYIHMYSLLIYSTAFCEGSFNSNLQKCHGLRCVILQLHFLPQPLWDLSL